MSESSFAMESVGFIAVRDRASCRFEKYRGEATVLVAAQEGHEVAGGYPQLDTPVVVEFHVNSDCAMALNFPSLRAFLEARTFG